MEFPVPINFDVEAEIMSTQSPNESTVPSLVTPDSHEQQPHPTMVDLTMDQAAPGLVIDTLLNEFDAASTSFDEECCRLRVDLQSFQSALDHVRAYSSQQEGHLTAEKTKWLQTVASAKESHLNEVRALHKRIGALASDDNAAQTEV